MLLLLPLLTVVTGYGEELTIEITKGVRSNATPIAVVPFGAQGPVPQNIAAIIGEDLRRSGRFEPLSPPAYPDGNNYENIRARGADHAVLGQVQPGPGGNYTVRFQLADTLRGGVVLGYSFNNVAAKDLRRLAHHISDLIFQKLTGQRAAFNARVAYINSARLPNGKRIHELVVSDGDGGNPYVVLRSPEPLMSPSWSPDGSQLTYVSFENRKVQIMVQDVYKGTRQVVAAYPGVNGAPSWSPDGRRLAFTLSKDGNPEIYVYNLANRSLNRLTSSGSIDTEPVWTPDGDSLIFTSDRGGGPQLYRASLNGGQPERLTFEGDYNASPTVSPDGRYLGMVHRRGGKFYVAVMDLQTRQLRLLSEGGLDESPAFSPDGNMLIYGTSRGGRGALMAVSLDGRIRQNLGARGSDMREPAWAPNTP
jgi:TolB protein